LLPISVFFKRSFSKQDIQTLEINKKQGKSVLKHCSKLYVLLISQKTVLGIENMFIGYARVSTLDQNSQLQVDALNEAGCKKIFTEKIPGADKRRRK